MGMFIQLHFLLFWKSKCYPYRSMPLVCVRKYGVYRVGVEGPTGATVGGGGGGGYSMGEIYSTSCMAVVV